MHFRLSLILALWLRQRATAKIHVHVLKSLRCISDTHVRTQFVTMMTRALKRPDTKQTTYKSQVIEPVKHKMVNAWLAPLLWFQSISYLVTFAIHLHTGCSCCTVFENKCTYLSCPTQLQNAPETRMRAAFLRATAKAEVTNTRNEAIIRRHRT